MGVVISIHALREEGDDVRQASPLTVCLFLSTPSARRATTDRQIHKVISKISIHALREEGDAKLAGEVIDHAISIHALREEGDFHTERPAIGRHDFYPRPPRGGRLLPQKQLPALAGFLSTPSARRATRASIENIT